MRRVRPVDASGLSARILDAIEDAPPGPSCVDLLVRWSPRIAAISAAAARRAGVVPLVAATLVASERRAAHRHVAVFVATRHQACRIVPVIKRLAVVSPRALVVFMAAGVAADERPSLPTVPDAGADDGNLEALVREGEVERAEAWWGALAAEATLTLGRCRDRTLTLAAHLRVGQGRFEEALVLSQRIASPSSRRGVVELVRRAACAPRRTVVDRRVPSGRRTSGSSSGGIVMTHLLASVPELLQGIADASEHDVLLAAAAWTRASAGARAAAFVAAGTGRILAASGPRPAVALCQLALGRSEVVVDRHGPGVVVTAPVRIGSSMVGALVLGGPAERPETLSEAATIVSIVCAPAVKAHIEDLSAIEQSGNRLPEIVGSSPSIRGVRSEIVRLAPAPFAVLIEGESGTGKELVARALHRLSPRRERRFVAVNCAALSDDLVETELFGHARGAFTGAMTTRTGLFEDAHGGTLFLDEVGELSARAQAKLLRVLQEHELRRVGENHARPIDVRVIAATNRFLAEAAADGHFREDLLFRLAVVRLRLVPLRDRTEDLAPLCQIAWRKTMAELEKRAVLGADALARLAMHDWPGNVRELQNVIAGLGVAAPARGRVTARLVDHVLAAAGGPSRRPPMSLAHARRICDRQAVTAALVRHAGRRSAAARELGVSRQGLGKLMRRLHLADGTVESVA